MQIASFTQKIYLKNTLKEFKTNQGATAPLNIYYEKI